MKHRKLRFAWSVACWMLGMAFLILWVRSQYWVDIAVARFTPTAFAYSGILPGTLILGISKTNGYEPWKIHTKSVFESGQRINGVKGSFAVGYGIAFLPFWLLILAVSFAGSAPWIQWSNRFSLRTLLIAITLIAGALGLIAWAAR